MKNILKTILVLMLITFGAVCLLQRQRLSEQGTQIAALERTLADKTAQMDTLQADQKKLKNERAEMLRQMRGLALPPSPRAIAAAAALPASPPAAETDKADKGTGSFGKMLSKLMEDPETRKFIREQQRLMMDPLYSTLIKQMGLSPEDAEKFKTFLLDQQMKGAEKATSLFGGSSSNRTEALNLLTAEQKKFDEQMKEFLGDARFTQYKDYQQTLSERMQLNQFKQQTAGSENALADQQTEQLLALMKEEKQTVAAATGQALPGTGRDQADLQALLSEEQADKLLQSQETVNQRVFERAKSLLSPTQLEAFGKFQTSQMQTLRMSMSMARQLFGPDKPESAPPQPNP
jgi:hypothetical protein